VLEAWNTEKSEESKGGNEMFSSRLIFLGDKSKRLTTMASAINLFGKEDLLLPLWEEVEV